MLLADLIREDLNDLWIPRIYEEKVRSQRTRSFDLDIPKRENSPVIMHTLLGVELKVGKLRIACPDLATARYLLTFARIGCQKVAVPYDITGISTLADEFETSWHTFLLLLKSRCERLSPQETGRVRSRIAKQMRDELGQIGAGELMPLFKQSTKQRNN